MYKMVTKKKFVRLSYLLKLHNKVTYGASGFCKNYTTKTPLYIYYIISQSANAACIILAFWYYVSVLDRVRATKERGTEYNRMNRTQCAGRSCWQYCRRWRGGITPGKESIVKGANKKNAIRFQVRYCGRGDCRRASAIRAHKVKRTPRTRGAQFQKVYDLLTTIINNE